MNKKLLKQLEKDGLSSATYSVGDKRQNYSPRKMNHGLIAVLLFLGIISGGWFLYKTPFINKMMASKSRQSPTSVPGKKEISHPLLQTNLIPLVIENKLDEIKRIMENTIYTEIVDEYGWSPLHWGVFLKNKPMVQFLVKSGANRDLKSIRDWGIYKQGTSPYDIGVIDMNKEIFAEDL